MEKPARAQRTKTETADAVRAFDIYVKMGDNRSHEAVGKEMGRSRATIARFATKYEWTKKLEALQAEENAQAHEQIKERYFADAEKMRDFKYTILDALKAKFDDNRRCVTCKSHRLSVGEMIEILRVTKTELGEPTSITKATMPDPGNDPFAVILARLFPSPDDKAKATA